MSEMWTTSFVLSTRLRTVLAPGRCGPRCQNSTNAGGALCSAAARKASPSRRYRVPNLASQMRTAFASIAWKTGSNSPGELEMTPSTSNVAVCCSSASLSSRVRACTSSNSRTFSIAITAWSAKVVTSSICLALNGRTVFRCRTTTPMGVPSRIRGTPKRVRISPILVRSPISYSGSAITSGM